MSTIAPYESPLTPAMLTDALRAYELLQMSEYELFNAVMAHIDAFVYEYPVRDLVNIAGVLGKVMPYGDEDVQRIYGRILRVFRHEYEYLNLNSLVEAAKFVSTVKTIREPNADIFAKVAERVEALRYEGREKYDIARLMELLAKRLPSWKENEQLVSCLCKHVHRHLQFFEGVDFVRALTALLQSDYRDARVLAAIGKWVKKRESEFSKHDKAKIVQLLSDLKKKYNNNGSESYGMFNQGINV